MRVSFPHRADLECATVGVQSGHAQREEKRRKSYQASFYFFVFFRIPPTTDDATSASRSSAATTAPAWCPRARPTASAQCHRLARMSSESTRSWRSDYPPLSSVYATRLSSRDHATRTCVAESTLVTGAAATFAAAAAAAASASAAAAAAASAAATAANAALEGLGAGFSALGLGAALGFSALGVGAGFSTTHLLPLHGGSTIVGAIFACAVSQPDLLSDSVARGGGGGWLKRPRSC
jgi:hypothetical protein